MHPNAFHDEKDAVLETGLSISTYINVDDTGAKHKGKNGYCTHIGNELFASFHSTFSKSRVNFLELLRVGLTDYVINSDALAYMASQGLPKTQLQSISTLAPMVLDNEEKWRELLKLLNFTKEHHRKIATEGALIGSLFSHGFNSDMVIISDDAGQFNVLNQALCWIHAERLINKLTGFNDIQKKAIESTQTNIWELYQSLKEFKQSPNNKKKVAIEKRFDEIFTEKTCLETLNQALKRIHQNKPELLRVLECPDIPLHNNLSENDIREYVKRRKVSGSTRSELGVWQSMERKITLRRLCFLPGGVVRKTYVLWTGLIII